MEEMSGWFSDGNDLANSGVWTHAHAYDNSDVSFFAKDINCCSGDYSCHGGGDAFLLCVTCDMKRIGN